MIARSNKEVKPPNIIISRTYGTPEAAVVQPERQLPVSLYSLDKWLRRLGVQRWSLVQALRRLALDSPAGEDGTHTVTVSCDELAEFLGLDSRRTVGDWLKSEPVVGAGGWRRISPTCPQAEALAHFIVRLRYAYSKAADGSAQRTGLVLCIRMDDPVIDEDLPRVEEIRCLMATTPMNTVTGGRTHLRRDGKGTKTAFTSDSEGTKSTFTSDREGTKSTFTDLGEGTKTAFTSDSEGTKATFTSSPDAVKGQKVPVNVNELTLTKRNNVDYFKELVCRCIPGETDGRNIRGLITPLVRLVEEINDDYHSRRLYYKVFSALYRADRLDLACLVLESVVKQATLGTDSNLGAVFTASLKELAQREGVELGLAEQQPSWEAGRGGDIPDRGKGASKWTVGTDQEGESKVMLDSPQIPGYGDPGKLWQETLRELELQMPKATFDMWIRNTQALAYEKLDGGREVLRIGAGNPFQVDWLANRLAGLVERAVEAVVGRRLELEFVALESRP